MAVATAVTLLCFYILNFGNILSKHGSTYDRHHVLSSRQVRASTEYGYVLAMRYTGQQGTGIQSLMSLQCFIGSFNLPMFILEPVMNETYFESNLGANAKAEHPRLKFSDMFDLAHFNKASRRMGFSELRSESELNATIPKNAIYVDSDNFGEKLLKLVWKAKGKKRCRFKKDVSKYFCIVRVVSIRGNEIYTLNSIGYQIFSENDLFSTIFGPWSPQSTTLIFKAWHTPWYVPNPSLDDPLKCKNIRSVSTETQFHTSSKLLTDAKNYEDRFLNSTNRLAIMFRLERMVIHLQRQKKVKEVNIHVTNCLRKAVEVSNETWRENGEYTRPLVTLDLGKYGSYSWNKQHGSMLPYLTEHINSSFSKLFKDGWTFNEWEQSFTQVASIADNGGYIAAFQRTLASRADCLILIGGGYFQELALNDYKRNHPDKSRWCIHLICAINSERLEQAVDGNVINRYDVN